MKTRWPVVCPIVAVAVLVATMALAQSAYRWITGHIRNMVEVHGQKKRPGTEPGRRKRSLATSVTCSNNNHIEGIHMFARNGIVYQELCLFSLPIAKMSRCLMRLHHKGVCFFLDAGNGCHIMEYRS